MRDDIDDLPEPPELDLGLDDMQIETLAGDLRDAMLLNVRDMKRPWSLLSQNEQRDLANRLELTAKEMVRQSIRLLTDWEWPRVVATLGDVKIIGGERRRIEAKITATNIADYRDALGERVGDQVLMLLVDSEQFMGQRDEAKTDPDQPELPAGKAA